MNKKLVKGEVPYGFHDFVMNCEQIKNKDKGLYIVHSLWQKHLDTIIRKGDLYFPLSSQYKKLLVRDNNDYEYFKVILEELFKVKKFSPLRKRCNYYAVKEEFKSGPLVAIQYQKSKRRRKDKDGFSIIDHLDELCSHLTLDLGSIKDIEELVERYRDKIKAKVSDKIAEKKGNIYYKGKKVRDYKDLDQVIRKYMNLTMQHHRSTLYSLECGDFNLPSRNKTNNRLDYIITRIPKYYMENTRFRGERLVEIDFANCQPMLFANLIRWAIRRITKNNLQGLERYDNFLYIKSIPQDAFEQYLATSPLYPLLFSEISKISYNSNIEFFLERSFSGTLYDENAGFNSRDDFKNAFMKAFFDTPQNVRRSESGKALFQLYPTILTLIGRIKYSFSEHMTSQLKEGESKIKLRDKYLTPNKAGSNQFAILLQSFESWLFIDQILMHLYKKGYPVFPKHDSFLVPASFVPEVYEEINTIMAELLDGNNFYLKNNGFSQDNDLSQETIRRSA